MIFHHRGASQTSDVACSLTDYLQSGDEVCNSEPRKVSSMSIGLQDEEHSFKKWPRQFEEKR